MSSCKKCKLDVGCSCNLIGSYCINCFTSNKVVVEENYPPFNPYNTTILEVTKTKNISSQEKVRRINEIISSKIVNNE